MLTVNINKIALREFTCTFKNKHLHKRLKLLSAVNLHLSGAWAMSSGQRWKMRMKSCNMPAPAAQR
jgi:hypothetical protein